MIRRARNLLGLLQELPAQLSDMRANQRDHRVALEALFELLRNPKPAPRHASALLLWEAERTPLTHSGDVLGTYPGFASVTFLIDGKGSYSGDLFPQVPVPAGAWLVALGCHFRTVLVGNDLMDLAMPDRSPCVRLSKHVAPGVLIRFVAVAT